MDRAAVGEHDVALPASRSAPAHRRAEGSGGPWTAGRATRSRYVPPHGAHPPRPDRPQRVAPVPRHDDLRLPVRRATRPSPSSTGPPRPASPSSTPPTSTRSAARAPRWAHRGDHRPLAAGPARRRRPGHQVPCPHRAAARGTAGNSRKHILERDRGLPAPAAHRLRRPLPAARPRPGHADRRDAPGARRPRAARARCATSGAPTSSPTSWPARSAAARCWARPASTRCSPATTCCSARSSASCCRCAPRRASA